MKERPAEDVQVQVETRFCPTPAPLFIATLKASPMPLVPPPPCWRSAAGVPSSDSSFFAGIDQPGDGLFRDDQDMHGRLRVNIPETPGTCRPRRTISAGIFPPDDFSQKLSLTWRFICRLKSRV